MISPSDRTGFQTAVWGPPAWVFLHTITFAYPEKPDKKTKKIFMTFFKSLCSILPCRYCRDSYSKYCGSTGSLGLTDRHFRSRDSLTKWLYNIHNAVNRRLGKNDNPSYSDIVKLYSGFAANCKIVQKEKGCGCAVPSKGYHRLRSVIRIIPRECKLKGKTLAIYKKCKNRDL